MAMFQSFVLSPKSVSICWAEEANYWTVSPMPNSRFLQKAVLLEVCFLQIGGSFDTAMLDKDTTYSVLYLFKHNYPARGLDTPAEVSLSQKDGQKICRRQVFLYPGSPDLVQREGEEWLALEAGRFQPSAVSREINFNLLDDSEQWKSGLVFAGVEIHAVSEE
ncbi:putative F-box protein PP2-B12 [Nymphaea thermarum]|nr:putative F-box protein PP2-B12 [Nymphaea thermarum]